MRAIIWDEGTLKTYTRISFGIHPYMRSERYCELMAYRPHSSSDPFGATFPPGEGILALYGDLAREISLEQGFDLPAVHALADGPHELGHGGLGGHVPALDDT